MARALGDLATERDRQIQLSSSVVISLYNDEPAGRFETQLMWLESYGGPVLCTEYMAGPRGSTFAAILAIALEHRVAAINWGLVTGKTQTNIPWDSWQRRYTREPDPWFHDILHPDGAPYRNSEPI